MTPHEVVKDSLEKFEGKFAIKGYGNYRIWNEYGSNFTNVKDYIKSSQLSLLLSVKEMVEGMKRELDSSIFEYPGNEDACLPDEDITYNQALSDFQSLLDSEIKKVEKL